MNTEAKHDLVQQFLAGTVSRRDFVARAAALGISAGAIGALLRGGSPSAAAQDQEDPLASWPPPSYIEEPDTEILMPIEGPLTEEKVTFRLLNRDDGYVTDFENNRMTEWLEEQTNVHIDWELVPAGESPEEAESKLNLMLASGDIPEIIFSIATPSQAQLYGSQGLFLPLNDLIAEHAPRLQKMFEVYPRARDVATSPDGTIYLMPNVEDCFQCSLAARLWIYQPWLDALGLEMPQTTDEFEQVLLAFKEQDPNGNGQADEIPLSGTFSLDAWNGPLDRYFMNSFIYNPGQYGGPGPWLNLQDGKVTPVYNTPQWRDGLAYLHRLYEQGLIDPQSFTQGVDGLQRLGNNPDTVILGAAPSGWWYDFVAMEPDNPRWTEYVAVPPLKGPGGVQYAAWEPAWSDPSAVITSACKDPVLAVRWIDTLYWQEASLRSHDGVLGEDWRWAEEGELNVGGTQALWKLLAESVGPNDRTWGGVGPAYWSSFMGDGAAIDPETAATDINGLLYQAAVTYEPYKQPSEWVLPPLSFNEEQATAIADPETTITQYVNQMLTAFVRGDTDLESGWDQYVSTLEQMGLAPYLQVYQDAYDAKYGG
jgi:putative aldouronate transport system substrate-binding protein